MERQQNEKMAPLGRHFLALKRGGNGQKWGWTAWRIADDLDALCFISNVFMFLHDISCLEHCDWGADEWFSLFLVRIADYVKKND